MYDTYIRTYVHARIYATSGRSRILRQIANLCQILPILKPLGQILIRIQEEKFDFKMSCKAPPLEFVQFHELRKKMWTFSRVRARSRTGVCASACTYMCVYVCTHVRVHVRICVYVQA